MNKEKRETIPVVFASSNTYLVQTFTAAYSVMLHCRSRVEFHFLLREDCPEEAIGLFKTLEEKFENCTCIFHRIDGSVFEHAYLGEQHVLTTTYYRLLIPSLMLECSRCIYLDSDVIVEKDLTEMYSWPMDGCVAAGVLAAGYQNIRRDGAEYCKKIGLPEISHYINAGILILKPSEIYESGLFREWMRLSEKQYLVLDQDIINISCYGKIALLPPCYNAMTTHLYYKMEDLARVYTKEEAERSRKDPSIIHYTSPKKPWNDASSTANGRWWKVFGMIREDKKLEKRILSVDAAVKEWLQYEKREE